jgi:hypothetical protein
VQSLRGLWSYIGHTSWNCFHRETAVVMFLHLWFLTWYELLPREHLTKCGDMFGCHTGAMWYWASVGRGQGSCCISYKPYNVRQPSPPTSTSVNNSVAPNVSTVRLRPPCVHLSVIGSGTRKVPQSNSAGSRAGGADFGDNTLVYVHGDCEGSKAVWVSPDKTVFKSWQLRDAFTLE